MASGDIVLLKKYADPITAMHTIGTTVYLVTNSGNVKAYTIAGGATTTLARLSSGDVASVWVDATYAYVAFHNGQLSRYTLADGAQLELAKFDSKITAMAVAAQGTVIYITTIDGKLHSYEI